MIPSTLGSYVVGHSPLHKTRASIKILGLICWIIAISVIGRNISWLIAPAALVVLGFLVARISPKLIIKQVVPVLPILLVIGAYQWWATDAITAARICLIIVLALLGAIVVTSTTSTTDMMDGYLTLLSPLAKLGVNTARIALAFSLTLQLIPAVGTIVEEIQEARRSRNADRSLRALFLPLIIRLVRRADVLAEALVARGYEDD